ncbi:hypothetical protein AB0H07_46505 [Streptomyces sp. NPDC021354]|uniref:hypothetical protein n=1 Tax=Streptomyces sp. NPDC021354 TaxID=3154793 RepID=UPI0033EC55A6
MYTNIHGPDYSFPGEPCARAGDLNPGDQIPVLGGAAILTVLDITHDTATGSTLLRLDVLPGGPAPPALPSDSLVNVRRPEREQDSSGRGDEPITVTVSLTVTEQVTYEFEADLEVPAAAVDDADALHDYLADNEDLWLDHLDPTGSNGYLCINERSLDAASVVLAT